MTKKTNNLEEEIDEVFQKELYDFWGTEEELKESGACCVLDTIEKFILNREKALIQEIVDRLDREEKRLIMKNPIDFDVNWRGIAKETRKGIEKMERRRTLEDIKQILKEKLCPKKTKK